MPKMACTCGHVMNLSVDNNPYEFSLVPEATIGEIGAKIADEKMASAAEFFQILSAYRFLFVVVQNVVASIWEILKIQAILFMSEWTEA